MRLPLKKVFVLLATSDDFGTHIAKSVYIPALCGVKVCL